MRTFFHPCAVALALAALVILSPARGNPAQEQNTGAGKVIATTPAQGLSFHGKPPVPQRTGINQAYAGAATGTITWSGNPAAADTLVLGTGTYTFTGTVTGANQVLIGASEFVTRTNFQHVVLGEDPSGNVITTPNAAAYVATGALVASTGTLTSDNTNVSDGDTVTIGTKVYTFKTTLTATEGQVHISVTNADGSLLNLINAINHTGTPGTDYVAAAANAFVSSAASVTSHTFVITALSAGAIGNTIASTETSAHLAFGATTLSSGTSATNIVAIAAGTAGNSVALVKSSSALAVSGSTLSGGTATPSATQDAVLANELRDALVQKGIIKGGP